MPEAESSICFLFDNGSLEADSTLSLRRIASWLQVRLRGVEIRPVSLLHSSAVKAAELGGQPAELLEPALKAALKGGANSLVLLPLFFGPSAAVTEYVPKRLRALKKKIPTMCVHVARCLVDERATEDMRIAAILADGVRRAAARAGWKRPKVALVDHGSPERAVTAVRDFLGRQLQQLLAGEISA
ncbi:MAG: cobalamin biosynthesis protein CbiX, partial [Verrucomicrobiota bacterium]|nr:cobalamin biosynthesis protein CbiX [Verrucomicrobiota bacterium]